MYPTRPPRQPTHLIALTVALVVCLCESAVTPAAERAVAGRIEQVQRLIGEGKLSAAELALETARQAGTLCERDALASIQLATAASTTNDLAMAIRQAQNAVAMLDDDPAADQDSVENAAESRLSRGQRTLVRLSAGNLLVKSGAFRQAFTAMTPLAESAAGSGTFILSPQQRSMLGQLMLGVGAAALGSSDFQTAASAYATAKEHCDGDSRATAILGHAWAIGAGGKVPAEAAEMLAAFVQQFPEHADAAAAAGACVTCLRQAGDTAAADQMEQQIMAQWPASAAAHQAAESFATLKLADLTDAFADWLTHEIETNLDSLSVAKVAIGIRMAANNEDVDQWDALVRRLLVIDQDGVTTADLLLALDRENHSADAERLAATAMVPATESPVTRACQEAACRWAGRTRRWTMLALASESDQPTAGDSESAETGLVVEQRSVAVERLYAESLMQTGRSRQAQTWWNHLVDRRNVSDFATLLRCAETAASHAPVDEADRRIRAARAAAGENGGRVSLVEMLSAELAIRKIQFDEARYLLAKVVRAAETPSGLRGRAQWMIGETFYMQKQFQQAIDAYRRVEGIDETDSWTAAALVQAGKSFEQLGRTREATVCYFSLVSRFAKSPHAIDAQRRLAAIAPENVSNSETLRR